MAEGQPQKRHSLGTCPITSRERHARPTWYLRAAPLLQTLVALSLAACQSAQIKLPSPVRVKTQDQAATVLVTTSMVAPWDNVSASLKPAFTMTGDTAVTEVLPTTEQIQSEVLSAFGASLGVGLPGSSTTSSSGRTQNTAQGSNTTGGVTTNTASTNGTTTSSSTTTTSPGVVPTPPAGTPAGGQLPTSTSPSGSLGLDPVLKYKAAAYLNQEVQLLNQEIENAAVRECFVPYVVKLKMAVMNYRPYLAYSVHTRVSFGSGPTGEFPPTDKELEDAAATLEAAGLFTDADLTSSNPRREADPGQSAEDERLRRLRQVATKLQGTHTSSRCLTLDHTPVVVPFLAADDMEVALKSRATEAAQQIAFALNFMVHGVGGNAGLNNLNTSLTAVTSRDLSSVLTVSRDNDNTLYIRIAPNNQASNDPSLIGQTYDVAVLLLIPRRYFVWRGDRFGPANISFVTYTQFRDADTGDILESRPVEGLAKELDRVLKPYVSLDQPRSKWWNARTPTEKIGESSGLLEAIVQGNSNAFRAYLAGGSKCKRKDADTAHENLCLDPDYSPALWAGLSSVLSDNSYKSASFEAPIPSRITIPWQSVLASDDKTHPISVLVGGVGGRSSATLGAHLSVVTKTGAAITLVTIPAQSLALDTTAHVLTLTFPSLGKLGLAMPPPPDPAKPNKKPDDKSADSGPFLVPSDAKNVLVIERVNCDPLISLCPEFTGESNGQPLMPHGPADHQYLEFPLQLVAIGKSTPNSIAKLSASGSTIAINKGSSTGVLPILVSVPATPPPTGETYALTVSGAAVLATLNPTGAAVPLNKNGYVLAQAGLYTINLINLTPGAGVTVSVQAIKPDGKTPDGDPATASFTAIPPTESRP